jgi:butyrate kinase
VSSKWILAVNPGSTSTKIAIFEDKQERYRKTFVHEMEELAELKTPDEQYQYRLRLIRDFLEEIDFPEERFDCVMGRGGSLPPVKSGAYEVNERMLNRLKYNPTSPHASNLGAMIAYAIAHPHGKPAYIYDSIMVDEMDDIAKRTGYPEIRRISIIHALNMHAQARRYAEEIGKPYESLNLIVADFGGGITMTLHKNGKMVDIVRADEGPLSPERSGAVPSVDLIRLCFSGKFTEDELLARCAGTGGFVAYFGVNDARKVEKMIDEGDEEARKVYATMGYETAKAIGSLAGAAGGHIDGIILTGGLANSTRLTDQVESMVSWIAPVAIYPGEDELEALALGGLRVLNGEEEAHEYDEETDRG